jgi:hypothetical protein
MFLRELREGHIAIEQYRNAGDDSAWKTFTSNRSTSVSTAVSDEVAKEIPEVETRTIAEQLAWRQSSTGREWRRSVTSQGKSISDHADCTKPCCRPLQRLQARTDLETIDSPRVSSLITPTLKRAGAFILERESTEQGTNISL